jgi:hypothetical protein
LVAARGEHRDLGVAARDELPDRERVRASPGFSAIVVAAPGKPPRPSFVSTLTLWLPEFAVAISARPSPLRSPTATSSGERPTA